ncbi:armadillo-type protein [Dipodascopsis uninucleata]
MEFLKSTIASIAKANSAFPYSTGEKIEFRNDTIWNVYHGTQRSDNSPCTIFEFDVNSQRSRLPLARNAVKKLRTLRFPGIIRVLDTFESESIILIATEKVIPLDIAIQSLKNVNNEVIKWGLYLVANTVKFINTDAGSTHGNIRMSSVYVTESGEWRLSGLELLTSPKEEEPILYTFGGLVPESSRYAAPEVIKSGYDGLRKQPPHLLDSYHYGILIYEVFNGRLSTVDQLQENSPKHIPRELFGPFRKLIQPLPRSRASVKQFVEVGQGDSNVTPGAGFFVTHLISLSKSLENLSVQNEYERDTFLRELQSTKDKFPPGYLRVKVLPELIKCLEYSGGGPKVLMVILDISQELEAEEVQNILVPIIVKTFSMPDRTIRLALLESLPKFIEHIPKKIVNDKLFPDMLTGFVDISPAIREQTVKAVLVIIDKLSERNINNDLLRHLAKTQNDEQPGIRTNTTVCLGKIAHNLGPHTRARVLIAAFTRSIRDPFVHARNAALMALAVTVDIFSAEDCCNKILPTICPSLLDKEKLVRNQAHKTLDIYLAKVKSYASSMSDLDSTQSLNSVPASLSSTPRPQQDTDNTAATDSSWSGWVNGFTKRLAVDENENDHGISISDKLSSGSLISAETNITPAGPRSATLTSSSTSNVSGRSEAANSSPGFGTATMSSSKFNPVNGQDNEDNDVENDFGWGDFDDSVAEDTMIQNNNGSRIEADAWEPFDKSTTVVRTNIVSKTANSGSSSLPRSSKLSTSAKTTIRDVKTVSGISSANNSAKSKAHSIAALKEQKKKQNIFADQGVSGEEENGWDDGW